MDKEIFLNLYKSIVRPHLEHATSIWTPMYKKDMIAIENVQRRATRLARSLKNKIYSEKLKILGLPTLEYRRKHADMIQVFKIINNINLVDKNKMFTLSDYTSTIGHPLKIYYAYQSARTFFSDVPITRMQFLLLL